MRSTLKNKKLGDFIHQVDIRNKNLEVQTLLGVSNEKYFMPSIANIVGTDLSSYKIVKYNQFAYGTVTSRNGDKISIALLKEKECIVSSSYIVFEINDINELNPDYLMMWFKRPEFDRYSRYMSHGSVRELFGWEKLCEVELPIPTIEEQLKIVEDYKVIEDRISIKEATNNNLFELGISILNKNIPYNYYLDNGSVNKNLIVPNDHEILQINDVLTSANTGADAIQKAPITDYNTGIKCARVGDLTNGRRYNEWAYCECSPSTLNNFILSKNDILVTRTATIGVTQFITENINCIYNNGLMRLKCNNKIKPIILYFLMNTKSFDSYIRKNDDSTSVRPNMKIEYVLNYNIILPSNEIQIILEKELISIIQTIDNNYRQISQLNNLKNIVLSILSKQ